MLKEKFKERFLGAINRNSAKPLEDTNVVERYNALASVIKERIGELWASSIKEARETESKQVYIFSLEFLTGKLLDGNLRSMDLYQVVEEGLSDLGISLKDIIESEPEQGLINDSAARNATSYLESLASLGFSGHGNGIRYKNGLFEQKIIDGHQVEYPDKWSSNSNVWEYRRPDKAIFVRFYGNVINHNINGKIKYEYKDYQEVQAVPYDTPVVGMYGNRVNTLRLWSAETHNSQFNYSVFSVGGSNKIDLSDLITQIIYQDDTIKEAQINRLKQEYFFVSAGIQSIISTYSKLSKSILELEKYVQIHLSDSRSSLAIPELIRILMDDYSLDFEESRRIAYRVCTYTDQNTVGKHEFWLLSQIRELLPRIALVIEDLDKVTNYGIITGELVSTRNLSTITHRNEEISKGIMHRMWINTSNHNLSRLLAGTIGNHFLSNVNKLKEFEKFVDDVGVQDELAIIKHTNKEMLAKYIKDVTGISVDPYYIFDIHAKGIQEYNRQHLALLHIVHLIDRIKANPNLDITPRVFIFAGKASPGDFTAKKIIRMITYISDIIERDSVVKNKIRVVFLPNYGVTLASRLVAAADVSENIGLLYGQTSVMKYTLNGALTITNKDPRILNALGEHNLFIVDSKRAVTDEKELNLKILSEMVGSNENTTELINLIQKLFERDDYFVHRDFGAYKMAHNEMQQRYRNKKLWMMSAISSIAYSAGFSSDLIIQKYAKTMWNL